MKIQLKNITKTYSSPVIKNLSYSFESGKIYVIKGVSGCGKTTLLNIIGGIETDFEGEVISDIPEAKAAHDRLEHTSYIFQNSLLLSNISVLDNLLLIKNDTEKIALLSEELGITDLLKKYPEQISGGERQRVSIARALLRTPDLLIADEPTASLDNTNSIKIADTIARLRGDNRIIIVATHEKYFDELADEIIYLKYGSIERVENNDPHISKPPKSEGISAHVYSEKVNTFKFVRKLNPRILKFGSLFLPMLAFLIVMLVSTVKSNFSEEYFRMIRGDRPMDLLILGENEYNNFPYHDRIVVFENYRAHEGDVSAYYLPPENASVFKIKGMVEYGVFPKNNNEILVSKAFIVSEFGSTEDIGSHIGKNITFKELSLTISGILRDYDDTFISNINADVYYRRSLQPISIFVPYETLKTIGEVAERPYGHFFVGVYDNILEDRQAFQALLDSYAHGQMPNNFYSGIVDAQETVNMITILIVAVLFICYTVSCIFMVSIVQTELFYRKKELGYLQIFGLDRKRICGLVDTEYIIKIAASFLISVVFYIACVTVYWISFGNLVFFDVIFTTVIVLLLFAIYIFTVNVSVKKFLKRSIVSLISEQ